MDLLPNKKRQVSESTSIKPIVEKRYGLGNYIKQTKSSSKNMSPLVALSNKLKGVNIEESQDALNKFMEKATATAGLVPNPMVSIPATLANFVLGATMADTKEDAAVESAAIAGEVIPMITKGIKKTSKKALKGLSLMDFLFDMAEVTPSKDFKKPAK